MFDRVLEIKMTDFDRLTDRYKWRFYEIIDDDQIRVEVPKGDNEALVVYLTNTKENIIQLNSCGFIEQNIKQWRDW